MIRPLQRYAILHVQNLLGALGRLARQPLATLMTVLVIAIALALPAGLRVLVSNAGMLSGSWEGAADFTVYLSMDVSTERAASLASEMRARSDVGAVDLITREEALVEFRARSGFGDALRALGDENPLPHALVVRPASVTESDVAALAGELDALPETELVQIDTAWVERLRAMLDLAARVIDIATGLLALAVVLVIGNTIRLEINNRSTEIEVTKLVGGSDAFIRRPFLYLGLSYGLAGAVAAAVLVAAALALLAPPVRALAELYGSAYVLRGLGARDTLLLLGSGALLGWAGAWLAAARHLRAIEPS